MSASTPSVVDEALDAAQNLARRFHEVYEEAAPSFGYKTRDASAVPWEQVPENNRKLMTYVAGVLIADLRQAVLIGASASVRDVCRGAYVDAFRAATERVEQDVGLVRDPRGGQLIATAGEQFDSWWATMAPEWTR